MTMYEGPMFTPLGWQCPVCRRVYSPTTPMCYTCGNGETAMATNTEYETKKAEFVRAMMVGAAEKCSCYEVTLGAAICHGTKEREECFCEGDRKRCTFYKKEE